MDTRDAGGWEGEPNSDVTFHYGQDTSFSILRHVWVRVRYWK